LGQPGVSCSSTLRPLTHRCSLFGLCGHEPALHLSLWPQPTPPRPARPPAAGLDADPKRPEEASSTAFEKAAAHFLIEKVRGDLRAREWPEPILLKLGLDRKRGDYTKGMWVIKKLTDQELYIFDSGERKGRQNWEFKRKK
jgi:hypothetical protein